MKRSEINAIMRSAKEFLAKHQFYLPPFSTWTPEEWRLMGSEAREIAENELGWDITDFGAGDFSRLGLFLFTIRNGRSSNLRTARGKTYAEKILIVEVDQITPMHSHWKKTEDIINRGGGILLLRLYNSTPKGGLSDSEISVSLDGTIRKMKAGDTVKLSPGESITVPTGLYHSFWAEGSRVLAGEVSTVNDDQTDNRFYKPIGRFPEIVEDEQPLHLLTMDYKKFYNQNPKIELYDQTTR